MWLKVLQDASCLLMFIFVIHDNHRDTLRQISTRIFKPKLLREFNWFYRYRFPSGAVHGQGQALTPMVMGRICFTYIGTIYMCSNMSVCGRTWYNPSYNYLCTGLHPFLCTRSQWWISYIQEVEIYCSANLTMLCLV